MPRRQAQLRQYLHGQQERCQTNSPRIQKTEEQLTVLLQFWTEIEASAQYPRGPYPTVSLQAAIN